MIIKKLQKGFTLIEMLVVISLIGILAALALVSFGASQKQARDTTRKSDLRQYQTALEMYGNLTNGLFPSRGTVAASTLCADLNTKLEPDITCSDDPKMATDPIYSYWYNSDGTGTGTATATKYILWGRIENEVDTRWVVCSNGKTGKIVGGFAGGGVCPI